MEFAATVNNKDGDVDTVSCNTTAIVAGAAANNKEEARRVAAIVVTGATGKNADIVNGVFDRKEAERRADGAPVFEKRGSGIWLFLAHNSKWIVGGTKSKDTRKPAGRACMTDPVEANTLPHEAPSNGWKVWDGGKFVPQPAVAVRGITKEEADRIPVSFKIELYARYSTRNDSILLSQAQADFWTDRELSFLAASGGKGWEEYPVKFAEEVDDDVRAAFWDAESEEWNDEDDRWFSWDSWDGFDGPSGPDRSRVFVTLNGVKPVVALNDFIELHGCRVEVGEAGASKHARHPRFTRAFMAATATAATAHVYEMEKHNSYGPINNTLEAGEALDLSKFVFHVSRAYDRFGHVSEDIVTGVSYGDDELDSYWDCCNGAGSDGRVERGNAGAAYAFAAGGALVRWWRRVLAARALAARRRKPKSATKTGSAGGKKGDGKKGGGKKAPTKPHGAKKADRALDPQKFDLASLMDVQIDAGTYIVDYYAGWMNEREEWGAGYRWSAEMLQFWSEPARRKLLEENPETWQHYWKTDVHGEQPDENLHPFFEWGDCDTEYLDVHVMFQCALGGKIVFPKSWGSTGHPGVPGSVSLDLLCEAAGEGSTRPPPQQWRIEQGPLGEQPEPPAAQEEQQQEQQQEKPWEGPQYVVHKGWRGSSAEGTAVVVEEACSFRDFIYKLVDAETEYIDHNCKCEERYCVNGLG